MSIAFRIDGSTAMKMISSTRSTSIIGVTLVSFLRPAAATTGDIAITWLLPAVPLRGPRRR